MSEATFTFSQSQAYLKLLTDKKVTKAHLQALLESGLLADLLGTHPGRIDREAFRAAIDAHDARTFLADIQLVHDRDSRHKLLQEVEQAGVKVESGARVAIQKYADVGPWLQRFRLARISQSDFPVDPSDREAFDFAMKARGYAYCPDLAAAEYAKKAPKPKRGDETRLCFFSRGMTIGEYSPERFGLYASGGQWHLSCSGGVHGDLVLVDTIVPFGSRE